MSPVTEKLPIIELPIGEYHRSLGCLEVQRGTTKTVLPLTGVDISARVADRVASVDIKQTFHNSFSEHLEAVYVFPLSGGCVVSQFEMRVGNRVVKGLVQERQEARRQYQQALDAGKRAALLEQERDDVFTMQVGNIPPNEEVTIFLTYSERLPYFENGKTELRLPLVLAPRYIPGTPAYRQSVGTGTEHDTNAVPDASRISPPRLASGFDAGVKLSVDVEIMQHDVSGSERISELACSQHATQIGLSQGGLKIELSRSDERLNRDFVLSWRLASKSVKSSLLVFHDTQGAQYGMLSIVPPKRDGFLGAPRDVVFVLDRSGSMQGIKMQSAARACSLLLHTLGPSDRFAIQAFDNQLEWMLPNRSTSRLGMFFPADEASIEKGDNYLRGIAARGGTELDRAIVEAFSVINGRPQQEARIPILVVITDGQVGNEAQILKRIQHDIGDARLFTVGVDTAVNSGLLKRVANLGGGTATFVAPGTDLERALKSVGREIGEPIITDLTVTGADGVTIETGSVAPSNVPDLFAGRAVTAFLKLSGKGTVRVRGIWSDGRQFDERIKPKGLKLPAIAQLWAKTHITDLEDTFRLTPSDAIKNRIVQLAVQHSLLTKFTAFVAVDHAEIVNKYGNLNTVVQPIETPALWGADAVAENLPQVGASRLMGQLIRRRSGPDNIQAQSLNTDLGASYGGGANAPNASRSQRRDERSLSASSQFQSPETQDSWSAYEPSPASSPPAPSPAPGSPGPASGGSWKNVSLEQVVDSYFESQPAGSQPAESQQAQLQQAPSQQAPSQQAPSQQAPSQQAPSQQAPSQQAWSQPAQPSPAESSQAQSSWAAQSKPAQSKPAQSQPAPIPVGTQNRFAGQGEAYGSAVRDQVFEVIVRQALAGAPWQEVCAGPMQVNQITSEEVEREVMRRRGLASGSGGSNERVHAQGARTSALQRSDQNERRDVLDKIESLVQILDRFSKDLHNGILPDATDLEEARKSFLSVLSAYECGTELPLLQKFLRTQLKELVQSLKQQGADAVSLIPLWDRHLKAFGDAHVETTAWLNGTSAGPETDKFWESSV